MATVRPVNVVARMTAARADLGLSGEGLGLRGGGVRGTAGFGAMLAAGRRPWMMCFCHLLAELKPPESRLPSRLYLPWTLALSTLSNTWKGLNKDFK